MNKITVVSLFSGCGGLDLGLQNAGLNIIYAVEIDKWACETYEKNIGPIVCKDINKIPMKNIILYEKTLANVTLLSLI